MDHVVIAVCSADLLVRPGVEYLLRAEEHLTVTGPDRLREADLAIVVAEELDAATQELLARVARAGVTRVLLALHHLPPGPRPPGVAAVLHRRTVTAESLSAAVTTALHPAATPPLARVVLPEQLQPRERDLLRLLADGYDTAEIARRLVYSERTVKKIVHGLLHRYELRNRAHAVAYVMRSGVL
ncbi:DNA-binding CsgD family transcriptional regulator [Crossiella equi]|uniref:DNA-binding CsgD family transcriptional regulator n=1 Tax=Crossiella equi TaxID=130796 RepID=A0ABS5AU71_9PSEU|nr:LuxR C-terminal-related transcriptional regulator [Crossiella equi]MBP2479245.1 DNA-binding CsgD family transcriptional regulator [Crossiella equi]